MTLSTIGRKETGLCIVLWNEMEEARGRDGKREHYIFTLWHLGKYCLYLFLFFHDYIVFESGKSKSWSLRCSAQMHSNMLFSVKRFSFSSYTCQWYYPNQIRKEKGTFNLPKGKLKVFEMRFLICESVCIWSFTNGFLYLEWME